MLALRPAPIQVNYLGYPGTMGADFVDYIVTDRVTTPPEDVPFIHEAIVHKPHTYQVTDDRQPIDPQPVTGRIRTEVQMQQMAQAQARTDISMQEMAQAQTRSERGLSALQSAFFDLSKQVGRMVNTIGFSLEDYTAALLPPYIERYFGISGLVLEQAHFPNAGGVTDEIDLAGQGVQAGEGIAVFAEVKTSIGGSEARRLADKLDAVAAASGAAQVFKLIVAMNIHPSAAEAIAGRDIVLLPYSRINRDRG